MHRIRPIIRLLGLFHGHFHGRSAQARAALEGERRLWVRNGNGYGPERRIAVTILRVSRDGRWARVRDDGGGAHRVSWNCLVDEVVARRFYPESAARIWG